MTTEESQMAHEERKWLVRLATVRTVRRGLLCKAFAPIAYKIMEYYYSSWRVKGYIIGRLC